MLAGVRLYRRNGEIIPIAAGELPAADIDEIRRVEACLDLDSTDQGIGFALDTFPKGTKARRVGSDFRLSLTVLEGRPGFV